MARVIIFFYHLGWTTGLLFSLPFILLARKSRIFKRLGSQLPDEPLDGKTIWIHALSVGEVLSAVPLVDLIKDKYPEREIAFTATTPQGLKVAKKELRAQVKIFMPMPFDFWWSIRRIIRSINPLCLIQIETDLWPGLLALLERKGIKMVLVNGRISPRTFRSYGRFRFFIRMMLNRFEFCLMQSELDSTRLIETGIRREIIKTVGNIKFDREWSPMDDKEYESWISRLNIDSKERIWVAGSTHEGEEDIIIDVFARLRPQHPRLHLIIAPRKIERAEGIMDLCESRGLDTVLRTSKDGRMGKHSVMVLDTIGELGRVYGIAEISFVGGSLVPVGGHNLLEPAAFGCPVIFGPHTHNFVLMSQLLEEAGGGLRVNNREDLYRTMENILSDIKKRERMGQGAVKFVESNRGALKRVMDCIDENLF